VADYAVDISVSPPEAGTIKNAATGISWWPSGSKVSISAKPYSGYAFSGWSGDLTGNSKKTSITMNKPRNITAYFSQKGAEFVSPPQTPVGQEGGSINTLYTYSTGGSTSNKKHKVEYRFLWGDGTDSGWLPVGTTSASKAWPAMASYQVTAEAQCADHPAIVPSQSEILRVDICTSNLETLERPDIATGPKNALEGELLHYLIGGSSSDLGHQVRYLVNWGDGTDSGWLDPNEASPSHAWGSLGSYSVRVKARCAIHPCVVSGWSDALSVSISPSISPETHE